MNNAHVQALLAKAIEPSSVMTVGQSTRPRTWGVYEIAAKSTTRHRMGNHPVRQQELVREFGKAQLLYLFTSRPLALHVAGLLNDQWRASR